MKEFNLKKTIKNDGFIKMFALNGIIFIVLGIVLLFQLKDYGAHYYIIGAGSVLFLLVLLRYLYLKYSFLNAEIITASITKTWYYRGSKVVKYEFPFNGKMIIKRALINYNRETKHLEKEEKVEIAYRPNNPRMAIIFDLYFDR